MRQKLDYETCCKIAAQCKSVTELIQVNRSVYNKGYRMKWIGQWFPDRKRVFIPNAELIAVAKDYDTVEAFSKCHNNLYTMAGRRGLIPSLRWLKHKDRSVSKIKYTEQDLIDAANHYKSRYEFSKAQPLLYFSAVRRKIFEKYNLLPITPEYYERHGADCVYVYEFIDQHVAYIGRTVYPHKRDSQHRKPGDSVYEYAASHNLLIPKQQFIVDGVHPTVGAKLECKMISLYNQIGWHLLNKNSGGSLGTLRSFKYTYEYCMNIAKQYSSNYQLRKEQSGVYCALRTNGWLAQCTWLTYIKYPANYWANASKDDIIKEASKYQTVTQFQQHSSGAYRKAVESGWIDDLFIKRSVKRPVNQYTLTGELVATYNCMAEAARALGVTGSTVRSVCEHIRGKKKCKNFILTYA